MSKTLVISNATVIDVETGGKNPSDILVEGERIVGIGPVGSLAIPADARTVDATGRYAIPGLWDAHVHMTSYGEMGDTIFPLYAGYGVTSVRDMGGHLETLLAYRDKALQKDRFAPRIWYAGPFINSTPAYLPPNPKKGSKSVEVDTRKEAHQLVDTLVEAGVHFIKPYEMLLPEAFTALAERAKHHGLKLAGHTPISMTIADILEIVPDYDIQHLGGFAGIKVECACHGELLHRQRTALLAERRAKADSETAGNKILLNVVKDLPTYPEDQDPDKRAAMIELFVEKGTWHTPTFMIMTSHASLGFDKDPELIKSFQYLPKGLVAAGKAEWESLREVLEYYYSWEQWHMETVGLLHEAGVPLLAGTDGPSPSRGGGGILLHFELQAMVQAGLSPLEALRTATINPAKFLEIEDDLGALAEGKYADLVLLDKDPLEDIRNTLSINSVFSRGQYLDRSALDDLFAGLAKEAAAEEPCQ